MESLQKIADNMLVYFSLYYPLFLKFLVKKDLLFSEIGESIAKVNRNSITLNSEKFPKLEESQQVSIVIKSILQIILLHDLRGKKANVKNPKLWNYACSIEAENIILDENLPKTMDNTLWLKRFKGMSAENIYKILDKSNNDNFENGENGNDRTSGEKKLNADDKSLRDNEIKQIESKLVSVDLENDVENEDSKTLQDYWEIVSAKSFSDKSLVAISEKYNIDNKIKKKMKWEDILKNSILDTDCKQKSNPSYSLRYPNRRHLYRNMILPGKIYRNNKNFTVAVDVSGSMSFEEIKECLQGVKSILKEIGVGRVRVMLFDTTVTKDFYYKNGQNEVTVLGRGGTDFCAPFQYLREKKQNPYCLIIFTDGECNKFYKKPSYPVIWVVNNKGKYPFRPPYGRVIYFSKGTFL